MHGAKPRGATAERGRERMRNADVDIAERKINTQTVYFARADADVHVYAFCFYSEMS
jgi:hypothetical protein